MSWAAILAQMMVELRSGSPRAQSYWAQQLAFGPVLVHALALELRENRPCAADQDAVVAALRLALGGLGPLPEEPGCEPGLLALLGRRQARAAAWGRGRTLRRLLGRLGAELSCGAEGGATSRLLRPYPLLGWKPDQPLPT
ncbi:MAG: hypothetical protein V1750_08870 [Acidobacteriota bacterium]